MEAAQGTPMKDKLTPMVDLLASSQEVEKARSSRFSAFRHFLGTPKLTLVLLSSFHEPKQAPKLLFVMFCWIHEAVG